MFPSLYDSFHQSIFYVTSILTTTGFSITDGNQLPEFSKAVILIITFIGACAGSTGGGIKVSRIIILCKGMIRELDNLVHPHRVRKVTMDGQPVDAEVVRSVNVFMVCYLAVFSVSLLLVSLDNFDLVTNFTAVTATINNIGPGLSLVGPTQNFSLFSVPSKLVLIFDMLAGRLELFPMLALFTPSTWKK